MVVDAQCPAIGKLPDRVTVCSSGVCRGNTLIGVQHKSDKASSCEVFGKKTRRVDIG
jgi:hypothetical protein